MSRSKFSIFIIILIGGVFAYLYYSGTKGATSNDNNSLKNLFPFGTNPSGNTGSTANGTSSDNSQNSGTAGSTNAGTTTAGGSATGGIPGSYIQGGSNGSGSSGGSIGNGTAGGSSTIGGSTAGGSTATSGGTAGGTGANYQSYIQTYGGTTGNNNYTGNGTAGGSTTGGSTTGTGSNGTVGGTTGTGVLNNANSNTNTTTTTNASNYQNVACASGLICSADPGVCEQQQSAIDLTSQEVSIDADIINNLQQLPSAVYKLDDCIPGPDYGWEDRFQQSETASTKTYSPPATHLVYGKYAPDPNYTGDNGGIDPSLNRGPNWVSNADYYKWHTATVNDGLGTNIPDYLIMSAKVAEMQNRTQNLQQIEGDRTRKETALEVLKNLQAELTKDPTGNVSDVLSQYTQIKGNISTTNSIAAQQLALTEVKLDLSTVNSLFAQCVTERSQLDVNKLWGIPDTADAHPGAWAYPDKTLVNDFLAYVEDDFGNAFFSFGSLPKQAQLGYAKNIVSSGTPADMVEPAKNFILEFNEREMWAVDTDFNYGNSAMESADQWYHSTPYDYGL